MAYVMWITRSPINNRTVKGAILKNENMSADELQETMEDVNFAVALLNEIGIMPEAGFETASVEVSAVRVRNCLELMLSLLEAHEGIDVGSVERLFAATAGSDLARVQTVMSSATLH